jgi:pimeloyl-ACP methyl ester carboxylesterase
VQQILQTFDVSAVTPFLDRQTVVGCLFTPDNMDSTAPKSLVVCLPGGTYSKSYYHFSLDGFSGYSMAEDFTERGHLVLTLDHLGVGESTRPEDGHLLTRAVHADVHHEVVRTIVERLAEGIVSPNVPPLEGLTVTGVGHSMGGMILVTQQGRHSSYDRIAALGWVNVPAAAPPLNLSPPDDAPHYVPANRVDTRPVFYMEDVPEAVIQADEKAATVISIAVLRELLTPGVSLEEAGLIKVPVFIGFGERDMSLNPYLEPSAYSSSSDVTLYILEGSAHCHNFSSTRKRLWRRVCNWIDQSGKEQAC